MIFYRLFWKNQNFSEMNSEDYINCGSLLKGRDSLYRKLQSVARELKKIHPSIRLTASTETLYRTICEYDPSLLPEDCRDMVFPTTPVFLPGISGKGNVPKVNSKTKSSPADVIPNIFSLLNNHANTGKWNSLLPSAIQSLPKSSSVPLNPFSSSESTSIRGISSARVGRGQENQSINTIPTAFSASTNSKISSSSKANSKINVDSKTDVCSSLFPSPVKRGRGRPKKNQGVQFTASISVPGSVKPNDYLVLIVPVVIPPKPVASVVAPVKRGRGRPRKEGTIRSGSMTKSTNRDSSRISFNQPIKLAPLTPHVPLIPMPILSSGQTQLGNSLHVDNSSSKFVSLLPMSYQNGSINPHDPDSAISPVLSPPPFPAPLPPSQDLPSTDSDEIPVLTSNSSTEENDKPSTFKSGGIPIPSNISEVSSIPAISSARLPLTLPPSGSFSSISSSRRIKSLASIERLSDIETGVGGVFTPLPSRIESSSSLRMSFR